MRCSVPTGRKFGWLVVGALVGCAEPVALPAASDRTPATIVRVLDGDSLLAVTGEGVEIELRVWGIDAPERGQPWSAESKLALAQLVRSHDVELAIIDTDRYGRRVVTMHRDDGLDIGAEMIRAGAAWVYTRYNEDAKMLDMQAQARTARRGLWSLPDNDRLPPWEWRNRERR